MANHEPIYPGETAPARLPPATQTQKFVSTSIWSSVQARNSIYLNVIKTAHYRRSNFLKTFISQEILGLRKNLSWNSQNYQSALFTFSQKNLANIAMRMEDEAFYNISMYLHNKNILRNSQIGRNGTESKIPYIESHSNIHYSICWSVL